MPDQRITGRPINSMPDSQPSPITSLGFGAGPEGNAPLERDAFDQSTQRLEREQKTTAGDYLGSMWRQDGLVDGFVANLAGSHMLPQEGYFAGTDPNYKDLSAGIWDDNLKHLYEAVSPGHAIYLRERLLQKQEDLTRLQDLGFAGNAGRLAFNVFTPDALLMSMAGGWVTRGIKAVQLANAGRVGTGIARAEAVAGVAANQAKRAASLPAMAGGVAFGAAENSAYEALRQSVNFEDDSASVAEAGLMGAILTAPFAAAGVRANARVARAAEKEHEVLRALKTVHDGGELTPEQGRVIREVHEAHSAIRNLEAGRIDEATFQRRLDEFVGPEMPDHVWVDRLGDRLHERGRELLDEVFPERAERRSIGMDTPRATGRAAPSDAQRAQMDAAVALEDTDFAPNIRSAGPDAPPQTAMALALDEARTARKDRVMKQEALRKAFDIEDAQAAKGDAEAAAKKAQREAAFAQAEADRSASVSADLERMINERELYRMQRDEPGFEPAPRPVEVPKVPEQDHTSWVGKGVTWAGPEGDSLEGVVKSYNPEIGKLIVETEDGMKAVHPSRLDDYQHQHAPEGFLAGSVGAAQAQKIASIANQRTAMSKARLDYFAILNRSEHEGVRELAFKLVKDAIQVDKHEAQGWTASEHKKHLQRTVGGNFHRAISEAARAAAEAAEVPMLQRGQFKQDFYELVSKVTRDPGVINPSIDPRIHVHLRDASNAMKEAYARMLKEAQKAGVKGAKDVPTNDLYVNRQWSFDKMRKAEALHGFNAMVDVVANAIKVPKYAGDPIKAARFLRVVRGLEFNAGLQNIHLQSRDMGTLRTELAAHGMPQQDIDDLVDVLFDARASGGGDAGQAANLKFRFDLDELASVQTPAGTLRLDDLFENDAGLLMDSYINSMGGHIGLAKVGIDSQSAWQRAVQKIQDDAFGMPGMDGGKLAKELGYLEDLHSNITGRPMSTADFSYTARLASATRAFTRSVTLGQLGLTAAFEMNRAVGLMGFKAVFSSMPSFRNFITALRQGYVPEPGLAEDIMHMTGFGTEMASTYARAHELEGGMVGGLVSRIEAGAHKLSHISDVISGNASFTSITRQVAAMAATKNAFDHAIGKKTLTQVMRERWVGQGLDDAEIDAVLKDLKDHAVSRNDVLDSIRYEDWQKAEPETYNKFLLWVDRQVRDAIQEQDIGETMPWMHTTIGKMIAELRTFTLVAHVKQFLKTLHYKDATAVQMYLLSFVAESMAYATQAAINYPDDLEERLSPERIANAAWFRMSINGLAPLAAESAYALMTGGDSLMTPGATANTENRTLWKTPSAIVSGRLINALPTLTGMLGAGTTTSREFNDLWRALPGSRLYGMPALGNYLADAFPRSEPSPAN